MINLRTKGVTIIRGRHVYVVLEIPSVQNGVEEPVVHGVFAKREYAVEKARKLHTRHKRNGYIAVLKQRLRGAGVQT